MVVDREHGLIESDNLSFEELCQYPSVLPVDPAELRKVIDIELMRYHRTSDPIDVSTMSKIQSLVGCGIGWSLLPESEIREPLVALDIDNFELTHSVKLFYNSHLTSSRAKEAFIGLAPATMPGDKATSEQYYDSSQSPPIASVA